MPINQILAEFAYISSALTTLPLMSDIQQKIDLILGTSLLDSSHYRMSPEENNILQQH